MRVNTDTFDALSTQNKFHNQRGFHQRHHHQLQQ